MSNAVRNYKDNVFCLLYREKKNLLSLYNAVNGTTYEKEEELEVVTLEEAICLRIRNDVFYNGTAKQPEQQIYRLSELFARKEEKPELELMVTVININSGCNRELLEKCESLRGYSKFVEKVREKRKVGLKPEEAVPQAVEECIFEGILTEFFREHKEEIVEMSIFEFDQELHDKTLFEDGVAAGIEKERAESLELDRRRLVALVCKKMKKNKGLEEIAEDLEEEMEAIEPVYRAAEKFAPEYNPELVFEEIGWEESGI